MGNTSEMIRQNHCLEERLIALFKDHSLQRKRIFSPEITAQLIAILREELMIIPCPGKNNPLSLREMLCLLLLASGNNPDRCAELMAVTPDAILAYLKRIHRKLKVNTRLQAFYTAVQKGYLQIMSAK